MVQVVCHTTHGPWFNRPNTPGIFMLGFFFTHPMRSKPPEMPVVFAVQNQKKGGKGMTRCMERDRQSRPMAGNGARTGRNRSRGGKSGSAGEEGQNRGKRGHGRQVAHTLVDHRGATLRGHVTDLLAGRAGLPTLPVPRVHRAEAVDSLAPRRRPRTPCTGS